MISALSLSSAFGTAPAVLLARALYEEHDWRGAWVEALRAKSQAEANAEAELIYALASLHMDFEQAERKQALVDRLETIHDAGLRAWGNYELGRIFWLNDEPDAALQGLKRAFEDSPDPELFAQAGYSLWVLLVRHPALLDDAHPLRHQLRTSRRLFTPAIRETAAPPPPSTSVPAILAVPAVGLVRLYQTQIGPAIGQRCSMHPSCSEYCLEATRRYGLVGIPMTADRLIRETDHVNHRIRPILIDGRIKYDDPVDHHSFWFRRYSR